MTLFDRVFNGSDQWFDLANAKVEEAISKYGAGHAVSLHDTD